MRKLGAWGLAAMLSLGLASQAVAEDEPDSKSTAAPSWWSRLFSRPSPQSELTLLIDAQDAKAQRNLEDVKARAENLAVDTQRVRERYLRREMVLDRIQQLAVEAGDMELSGRIEALRERAFAVCQKKKGQADRPASPERTREGKP